MEDFRIYFVGTARSKPGKGSAAAQWWREKGQSYFESYPNVKSLRVFATQFGLGPQYNLEFWFEIGEYATLGNWDRWMESAPEEFGPGWGEFVELFDSGPSRIMGDWPESHLT